MTDGPRYRRLREIYHAVCDLEEAVRRDRLDTLCEGDEDLRREVENLLAHDAETGDVFSDDRIGAGLGLALAAGELERYEGTALPQQIGRYRVTQSGCMSR